MAEEGETVRVRLPRGNQVLGEVEEVLGGSRFRVECTDDKTRICRIPGKFRRRIRVRAGFIVLVEPWDIEPDEKGDVVWIYKKNRADWLRKKGYI